MNPTLPLISIQILNWNRAEETLRAIASAQQQTYPNIEIVFVDNGSTDNSVALVKENYPNVKVVQLDKNYGCPGGRNRGVEFCKGEFIFYLDNDGVLHRDAVSKAYDIMKNDKFVAVVTGQVYEFDSPHEINTSITPLSTKKYLYNNFQGGISMHRKDVYKIVGYYPDHFMYGGEESYLTCKILDKNFKIVKDESIILWHIRSSMARNREKELINSFYNKLYLSVNLYPLKQMLMFMMYFLIRYPKYAEREGIKRVFMKTLPIRYIKVIWKALRNRSPIKKSTYKRLTMETDSLNNLA